MAGGTTLWCYNQELNQVLTVKPLVLWQGAGETRVVFKHNRAFCTNKACAQKVFYQSLTFWAFFFFQRLSYLGEKKYPSVTPVLKGPPGPPRSGELGAFVKLTGQGDRLTKTLRPAHRHRGHSPPGLPTRAPHNQLIMFSLQQKIKASQKPNTI